VSITTSCCCSRLIRARCTFQVACRRKVEAAGRQRGEYGMFADESTQGHMRDKGHVILNPYSQPKRRAGQSIRPFWQLLHPVLRSTTHSRLLRRRRQRQLLHTTYRPTTYLCILRRVVHPLSPAAAATAVAAAPHFKLRTRPPLHQEPYSPPTLACRCCAAAAHTLFPTAS
jgi:hypothetical protein